MFRLSLQLSPASEASAFNKTHARVISRADAVPLLTRSSSRFRYSSLNRTMYFLTRSSCVGIFTLIAVNDESESLNPLHLVEARH